MLGISDLARPSTDYVELCELVYAHSSNSKGVVMSYAEILYWTFAFCIMMAWVVFGGEGDE